MKTITLGSKDDNPTYSICRGHVTATVFNRAFAKEGWRGCSWIRKNELSHEYWIKLKRSWKKSEKGKKGAVPVTVSSW